MPNRQRTLLYGWELGGGMGHITRARPIIAKFIDAGWKVVAAVRDVTSARSWFAETANCGGLTVCQAPIFSHRSSAGPTTYSLADTFAKIGFADQDVIEPVVKSWDRLIAHVQPSLVVSDTSPSLNVMTNKRVPTVVVGNGWTIPPAGRLNYDAPVGSVGVSHSRLSEGRILDAFSSVLRKARLDEPTSFSELLRADKNYVLIPQLLDAYRKQRMDKMYCPTEMCLIPPRYYRQQRADVELISYFPKGHPVVSSLIAAMSSRQCKSLAYMGGESAGKFGGLEVSAIPLSLDKVIPSSKLVISHGGLSTILCSLANRIPQIIIPTDLEKALMAVALSELGFAVMLPPSASKADIVRAISLSANIQIPAIDLGGMTTITPYETLNNLLYTAHELLLGWRDYDRISKPS